ncbi:MAG: PocR ligand-binding domain-containing protein [Methanococcaceae archaeon]
MLIPKIKLSELIDSEIISSMMESFYNLTGIPMALIDLEGNVIAGGGWQGICTKFHRKHPETLRNCINSDTKLTTEIPKGEFRLYKCKNGMWDMATPLFFEDFRIGNLYTGQFFFIDEEPDFSFFSKQALKYDFNETEYLEELRKVPRLERKSIENAKTFMVKLASTLAQLGFRKLKLEKALEDTRILLSNQKEIRFLLEQAEVIAHLGSWQLDLTNNNLSWSAEVYSIFGISPHDFDPTYEAFLALVHPDDKEKVALAYSNSLKEESPGYEIEHRIVRRNSGEIRWVQEKCKHFRNISGEVITSIGMVHDITERKKSEDELRDSKEKLNIAIKVASIGLWEWHIHDNKFSADEETLLMLGLNKNTFDETFTSFEMAIHEDDLSHFRHAISTSMKCGKLETLIRSKSRKGRIRQLNIKALVYKDSKNINTKMFGVCFNITGLRDKSENITNWLNEELLRSNKELEAFAYVASHDLQEPLRMMTSFVQLLERNYKDRILDDNAQEYIHYIVDGATRMHSLLNGLLSYSRIQTRARKFESVDLNNIIESVKNSLTLTLQEKNAILQPDELPTVMADRNQMIQLFQNLISNSVKFCERQPIINISTRKIKSNYIFSITDNGIGIDPTYNEKIFGIFQRLHPRDKYDGTGIGLAICKRIVERHGGKIWVESKINEGSIFSFVIPSEINYSAGQ